MAATWTPNIVIDWRIEAVVHLTAIAAAVVAAYHAGQTGEWVPLMAISMLVALVVLFVTSE